MDGRALCMIFAFFLFIVIIYLIFSGKDDDNIAPKPNIKPKQNLCNQTEQSFDKHYLVENNLSHLRLNDNYTDIELMSQDTILRAHKIILASHSPYFIASIWQKNESEQNAVEGISNTSIQRLNIEFIDHKTLITVLNFIYNETLAEDVFHNATVYGNLLRAATKFQMDSLKCEISKNLNSRLNIHNVGSIVALAAETNTYFLMIISSTFLLDQFQQISKTTEWQSVIKENKDVLANAIDFHGKLPEDSVCKIQCVATTLKSPVVVTRLREFFLTHRFADAEMYVTRNVGAEPRVFRVNRATLIGQSVAFQQAFGESHRIDVHDIVGEVMDEFLLYMYSGWPTLKMKRMAADLLYLSAIYKMNGLQKACEDILIAGLDIQNAAKLIIVADGAKSNRLFDIVLEFILKHHRDVVKTNAWIDLKRNHPEILTKILH